MLEKSNLSKRRQDTSDLPYEAEGLLGCGHLADLLHAGALGLVSACFHMAGHLGSSLRGKRSVSWVLELSQVLFFWPDRLAS